MKLRDMMFLVIGGLLVISGMVLNTLISGDAEAQVGRNVFCKSLIITDKNGKWRGYFGLENGNAELEIYGEDGETEVAYLGGNTAGNRGEMMFRLTSKSKTDRREVRMMIGENGGRFDGYNRKGLNVVHLGVRGYGGGGVDLRDRNGRMYVK